jgi:hypothetical protein
MLCSTGSAKYSVVSDFLFISGWFPNRFAIVASLYTAERPKHSFRNERNTVDFGR